MSEPEVLYRRITGLSYSGNPVSMFVEARPQQLEAYQLPMDPSEPVKVFGRSLDEVMEALNFFDLYKDKVKNE